MATCKVSVNTEELTSNIDDAFRFHSSNNRCPMKAIQFYLRKDCSIWLGITNQALLYNDQLTTYRYKNGNSEIMHYICNSALAINHVNKAE